MNEVIAEIKTLKLDIAVITETKKKGQGSESMGYYDHFYSGVPKDRRAQQGISILIRRNLRKYIQSWEAISERIIKMNLTIYGHRTTIIEVYGVNDDSLVSTKDKFFEDLKNEIMKVGKSREIIILGDLNSRVGKNRNSQIVGPYGEDTRNDNGNRLITLCEQNDVKIMNGYYQHRDIHKYTWIQPTRNLKSIIDYTIVRRETKWNIQDVRVHRGATCGSDHHLLRTIVVHKSRREHRESEHKHQIVHKPKRYNLDSPDHESTKELYKKRLNEKLTEKRFTNPEEYYEYIKTCIHSAAYEALGMYEPIKKRKPYWWAPDI
ncbi:craniofacial development protein 2-like [Coccinella septempunctata]|uniref:craniofacial development protein 2-like n=1 Tax=Coccinella septempunctata TaxID=41139 RepID=UPI001D089350|nr:craniofacial development protein 2-like [Coccinella septempunctata]